MYASDGYSASVAKLSQISLATDNVFSDGAESETPTVVGSVEDGYVISRTVTI